MTLVELMVGLVIGLFVVSAALGLALRQMQAERGLLKDGRMRIDLQAAADRIVNDLRRSGYRGDASIGIARTGVEPFANPYTDIVWTADDSTLMLKFSRDTLENQMVDSNEEFRFRLHDGVVDMKVGGGTWQAVTDSTALMVTAFSITPATETLPLGAFCEQACPASDVACPSEQIRRYDLVIAARSATDAAITRSLSTTVRVRNDLVTGACPT